MNLSTLPWPKKGKKLKFKLTEDLILDQWIVEKNTEVVLTNTENFGFIHLEKGAKDVRGFEIPRKIFRY